MPDLVVVAHHLDPLSEEYVLTVGTVEDMELEVVEQTFDEHGEPVFEPGATVEVEQEDGSTVEHVLLGPPATTRRTEKHRVVVPVEDFKFSAYDERWQDKSDEEIVREQKRLVRAALRKREEDAQEREVVELPGVGDAL